MPVSFRFRFATAGCAVAVPVTLNEPASLIFVSSAMVNCLARSRLTPSTLMDRGASSTFAAGLVRRSSAEILASRRANSRRSYCQGRGGVAPSAVGWGAVVAAGGGGGAVVAAGGGGGAAVCADAAVGAGAVAGVGAEGGAEDAGEAAGTVADGAGVAASLSKLKDPSGSSQVTSFTSLRDSESLWAWRPLRSSVVPLNTNSGTVTQSISESFGLTARSVSATLATSTFKSTSSCRENL